MSGKKETIAGTDIEKIDLVEYPEQLKDFKETVRNDRIRSRIMLDHAMNQEGELKKSYYHNKYNRVLNTCYVVGQFIALASIALILWFR